MQRLGQHFLRNPAVLKKIVDVLELKADDRVVEIGPGHGELTAAFAGYGAENAAIKNENQKTNFQVAAIEKDIRLAAELKNRFTKNSNIEVLEGDALDLLPEVAAHKFGPQPWKLAGNIPYYITGKLLRTVGELEYKPERAVFMVQKEVAERMCAVPPDMNRLAASVQFWADAKIITHVPKKDFSPAPKVDSAVVLLKTKSQMSKIDPDRYYELIRALFAQPRKTILNNVMNFSEKKGLPRAEIEEFIKKLGLDPSLRPQNLSIADIERLAS